MFASQRSLNTDTSAPSSNTVIPPPGFNAQEARKPLARDVAPEKVHLGETTIPSTAVKLGQIETTSARSEVADGKEVTMAPATNGKSPDKKKEEKKTTVWQKVKHGVQHFWDGTKLLGAEIKISSNLALKMAAGYELSRRERRQACSS